MGVPSFLPWLYRKYPSLFIKAEVKKATTEPVPETSTAADKSATSAPKNNHNNAKVECDNFYIDMNGIIHQCSHPDDQPVPESEDEMMAAIFEAIDHLFAIVRPQRLFYMAIDGVAPRAKMNQQRSRRFTAAHKRIHDQKQVENEADLFDSNCITPGTPFMDKLGKCLRFYIHDRLNTHPDWKGLKVILSDASVPGEGEHKIMDFIRRQRAMPQHDPNTHHVLYGADADLIMLSLATHEPYFTIIREDFRSFFKWKKNRGKWNRNKNRPMPVATESSTVMNQAGNGVQEVVSASVLAVPEIEKTTATVQKAEKIEETKLAVEEKNQELGFVYLRVNVLREYLQRDLFVPNLPFKFDAERAIDDWVFLCLFIGNDFLPHLPSLMIREGAIHRLLTIYKKCLPLLDGYITHNGFINFERARYIMVGIAEGEDDLFQDRRKRDLAREKSRAKQNNKAAEETAVDNVAAVPAPSPAAEAVIAPLQDVTSEHEDEDAPAETEALVEEHLSEESEHETESEPVDPIRFWEVGWRDRYFKVKFNVKDVNLEFRNEVAKQYAIGLCWVLRYYYQGVPSWNWYYPYHYPPVAMDFLNIEKLEDAFDGNSEPFEPFEQLMAVLPSGSKDHVPTAFQKLMYDPESEILEYYPVNFRIDKKAARDGLALLPFVDENKLKNAMKKYYTGLTEEEKQRNIRGNDCLFVHQSHPSYQYLNENIKSGVHVNLKPTLVDGMTGKVRQDADYPDGSLTIRSPMSNRNDIVSNQVLSVKFINPQFVNDFKFDTGLLNGVTLPENVLRVNKKRNRKPRAKKQGGTEAINNDQNPEASTITDTVPSTIINKPAKSQQNESKDPEQ